MLLAAHIAATQARTVLWDLTGDTATRTLPTMQPKPAGELYRQADLIADLLPQQLTPRHPVHPPPARGLRRPPGRR